MPKRVRGDSGKTALIIVLKVTLAGEPGFEPGLHDPESCVLPLDDSPALPDIITQDYVMGNVILAPTSQ